MKPSKVMHFDIQRKLVAHATTETWKATPHIGYIYEPDVADFFAFFKKAKAEGKINSELGFNTLIMKVLAEGLKEAPQLNANFNYSDFTITGTLKQYEDINANVTWTLPDEKMMTITFRDLGRRTLDNMVEYIADMQRKIDKSNIEQAMLNSGLNDTLKQLKHGKLHVALGRIIGAYVIKPRVKPLRGKEKKAYFATPAAERITSADIEKGTVTFSNIGAISRGIPGTASLLSLIDPQVFVACVGTIQKKPVVKTDAEGNDTIVVGQVMPICMVFDHRAVDFAELVPMLRRLEEIFHNPEQILNW